MTIHTRNNALWALMLLALISVLSSAILLCHGVASGRITNASRFMAHFTQGSEGNIVFGYRVGAVISSLFIMLVYVAVAARFMFVEFEKTQSAEIVYLIPFTFAVLCDTTRLAVPFFDLYLAASSTVNAIGRTLLFARTLAPLSLLFAAAFSDAKERTNTDRNIVVILALSIALSVVIPVNTAVIERTFAPRWGEGHIVSNVIGLLLFAAVLSFFISSHLQGLKAKGTLSVVALAAGYGLLCNATSYFAVVIGSAALFCGTAFYLVELHKQYLWK